MRRDRGFAIDPARIAFDIDGVVADTMELFVRLARERYGLASMTKDDIAVYNLYECLPIEKEVIDELICLTLDDEHTLRIPPMPGAPEVLTELSLHAPLRFVTARIWPESITRWLHDTLPDVSPERIEVTATGSPVSKPECLKRLGVRYFVEDRLETCGMLAKAGIEVILFSQPWNMNGEVPVFARISDWIQLKQWVLPSNGGMR